YQGAVTFPAPAPTAPYSTTLTALNGTDPNGSWTLYVLDDSSGDSGVINAGWTLNLTTVNPVNPAADLAVGTAAAPASIFVGSSLTFTFNVTNLGPASASDVVLKDLLPSGFTFLSGSSSQGAVSSVGTEVTCNLGTLASGATASVILVTLPANAGTYINTATISGNCTDLNPNNNAASGSASVFSPLPARLTGQLGNNAFDLSVSGQPGLTYLVQASTNLTSWVAISTNTMPAGGSFNVSDPTTPDGKARFYRTVRLIP
ncbi:MAG TPA: DUF11 domain-containing protein, partial [Bacillota bacterium]|nr:DUF11 domain-containing protein [Bacillota bacterium]